MQASKKPSLQDFYDDMNEHAMADYQKVGPYVIEVQTAPSHDGVLSVWEVVGDNPRNSENSYAWVLVGQKWFDSRDRAATASREVGRTREKAREWSEANRPGTWGDFWQERYVEAEWYDGSPY
jgi:hypothetical protein